MKLLSAKPTFDQIIEMLETGCCLIKEGSRVFLSTDGRKLYSITLNDYKVLHSKKALIKVETSWYLHPEYHANEQLNRYRKKEREREERRKTNEKKYKNDIARVKAKNSHLYGSEKSRIKSNNTRHKITLGDLKGKR